jgi:hypothetical protein
MDTKWRNFDCLSRCNQMVKWQQNILVLKLASWRQRTFHWAIGETTGQEMNAIFETQWTSHPINFGMPRNTMPIFRNTSIIIEPNKTVITTLFNTQNPLISGYISKQNLELLKGQSHFNP